MKSSPIPSRLLNELICRCQDGEHNRPIDGRALEAFLKNREVGVMEGEFVPVSDTQLAEAVAYCWSKEADGKKLAAFLGHDETLLEDDVSFDLPVAARGGRSR